MADTKVTKELFEGEWDGETYEVRVNGEYAGTVRRHDGTPTGYYGRWSAGRYYTDTRRDAVRYVVARYAAKKEN